MIQSIRLLNWRSHQDTTLQFRKGTNLLVGIMGSGKSSVLDGISFALYGTAPALERRKLKLEDFLRLNESEARVSLEFLWGGNSYRAERTITRTKNGTSSSASLFKDGLLLESGTKAVTTYIEQLLGVDYDLFTRAIYSEQNNTDYFLNLDPRRRKQEIDALLGLDRFEDARANIVSVINRVRSNRKVLEGRFSNERLKELEKRESELQVSLEELLAKQKSNAAALAAERKCQAESEKKFRDLKSNKERFEAGTKEHQRLIGSLDSIRKELDGKDISEGEYASDKQEHEKAVAERSSLIEKIKMADLEYSKLSKEAGQLESRIKSLEDAAKKLTDLKGSLSKVLDGKTADAIKADADSIEKEYIALNSESVSLNSRIAETEDALKALKPDSAECPLCGNKLTREHAEGIKDEKARMIAAMRERISNIGSEMPKRKSARELLLRRLREAELASERISALDKESGELPSVIEKRRALDTKLQSSASGKAELARRAEAQSEQIQNLALALSQQKVLLAKKSELQIAEAKLIQIQDMLKTLTFDENSFEQSRQALEDSRIRYERLDSESSGLVKELQSMNQMIPLVKKELDGLRGTWKEIQFNSSLEEELILFRQALSETQTSLRASLCDAINSAMGEVWTIFYPYHNYPSLRLEVTDKDYLFQLHNGAEWKPLESIASGGERASAALTLRVALAMVLTPSLSWLILDEPTHNLDREAIMLLSETLQLKVPEVVSQTFVITHEEALMGSEFASSYRLKRDKEHNGPTKAEEM